MTRLPNPGSDAGAWGTILNDYLSQVHKPDGTLKDDVVTAAAIAPGSLSKNDVGLGNVDNTSDASKPISTATQTALDAKLAVANNLSDLASATTARANLGLGNAATRNVGTTSGTVAAGDTVVYKGALTYNVKDYGATGDGSTDDRAAIQSAISAANSAGGGVVYLPAGTYMLSSSLTLPSNIHLQGVGPASILKHPNDAVSTGYLALVNTDTVNGNNNITLSDFALDCNYTNRPAATNSGIRFLADDSNACDNITIRQLTIRDVPVAAMQVMNTTNFQVVRNRVDDTGRDGITIWFNSTDGVIEGNIVTNTRDDCIALNSEANPHVMTQIKRVSIVGNTVGQAADSVFGTGINVAGATDVAVQGNTIDYAQGWGIVVQGGLVSGASLPSRRISVTGNTIRSAGTATSGGGGIATANGSHIAITGNTVDTYYGNGIQIAAAATVSGNTIGTGATISSLGIYANAKFTAVTGNRLEKPAGHGIQISQEKVSVIGNTIEEAGQLYSGAAAILVGGNINRANVSSNTMQRLTTGTYGIRIATGSSTGCIVTGNVAQGYVAGNGISDGSSGGTHVIANNSTV